MKETLIGLLQVLPRPRHSEEYKTDLDELRQLLDEYLSDSQFLPETKDPIRRNPTGALVDKTLASHTGSVAHLIASVNQPSTKLIQATAYESRPMDIVPDSFPRPSLEELAKTIEETRMAIEALLNNRLAVSQPSTIRAQIDGIGGSATKQLALINGKQVLIEEKPRDPLSPPRYKHKRAPAGPPSPPAPILHSPPRRKVTPKEWRAWRIPPCVSNWKNPKGYTVPLDKRLASDGRFLIDRSVSTAFSNLAESLYVAEGQAREELSLRAELSNADPALSVQQEQRLEEYLREHGPVNVAASRVDVNEESLFDPALFNPKQVDQTAEGSDDEIGYTTADRRNPVRGMLAAPATALVTGTTFIQEDTDDKRGDNKARKLGVLMERDYSQPLAFGTLEPVSTTVENSRSTETKEAETQDDPFGLDAFLSAAKSFSSSSQRKSRH